MLGPVDFQLPKEPMNYRDQADRVEMFPANFYPWKQNASMAHRECYVISTNPEKLRDLFFERVQPQY